MLKLAIQDLWDQTKKNSWCTSRGPHVLKLANVMTNPCLMWPHYIFLAQTKMSWHSLLTSQYSG